MVTIQANQLEHPALTHIEKTLAEGYRKEIDLEETVWRSLPFFVAALALQLAAVFQIVTRLPPIGTIAGRVSAGVMGLTGALMAVAPGLLAACIAAARFQYVSSESSLLAFADTLIQAEEAEAAQGR